MAAMTYALPNWAAGLHHDGSALYVSNPLPALDETVTMTLRVPLTAPVKRVALRATLDGEVHNFPMHINEETTTSVFYRVPLPVTQPNTPYDFKLLTEDGAWYYTAAGLSRAEAPEYEHFKLLAGYEAPLWVRDAVFYQIFVDRFFNGDPSLDVQDNEYERDGAWTRRREWGLPPASWQESRSMDFFGGDIPGIIQKLGYLQQLGVTALYLNPVFAALSNHKFDILDFYNVDQHFGGNSALADLRQALDMRGMHLILDVTPNHISHRHPWYTAVQADPKAPTREYFFYNEQGRYYETWLGVSSLIKLNYTSAKLRGVMYRDEDAVLRHWLREPYRIDGWRLDVANMTGNWHAHQLDHAVWREVRAALKADDPQVYLMGEYFMDATMHLQGDELDACMNYMGFNIPMRRWLGGADAAIFGREDALDTHLLPTEALAEQWTRFMAAVPYTITLQQFNQLSSHDITRLMHVCNGDVALVKLGMALLMGFPGVPCIYYGDEIGLDGARDPDNRRCMPWDDAESWNADLYAFCQHIIAIRQDSEALRYGGFQLLHASGDTIAFQRQLPGEVVIVVGYRGPDDPGEIRLNVANGGIPDGAAFTDRISGARYRVVGTDIVLTGLAHGQALMLG